MTWQPESFARRWALEHPFTEIDHSLQAIDVLEHGFMKPSDIKKGSSGVWDRLGGLLVRYLVSSSLGAC